MKTNDLISMAIFIIIVLVSMSSIIFLSFTDQGHLTLVDNKLIIKSKLFTIEIANENDNYDLYSKINKTVRYAFNDNGILVYYNLIEYPGKIKSIKIN